MGWLRKLCPIDGLKFIALSKRQAKEINKLKEASARKEAFLRQKKHEITERVTELKNLYAEIEKAEALKNIAVNLAPTWYWVKAVVKNENGEYVSGHYEDVNNLFREEFMCNFDREEIIGYTDGEMAAKIKYKYGEDSFTFGEELCTDSDNVVIRELSEATITFTENGKIRSKMRYVIVHKRVMFNVDGEPIATIGTGRDITEDFVYLQEMVLSTSDENTRCLLEQYLEKYHFLPNQSKQIHKEDKCLST